MNFELAHQRVQLQGKVAETESRAALMRETMQEKVSTSLKSSPHCDVIQGKRVYDKGSPYVLKSIWLKYVQIQKLESEHKTQLDSLIARYAREHSQSEATRLKSQLATREVRHFTTYSFWKRLSK